MRKPPLPSKMPLSSSCVAVHLIPQLSIEGKKAIQARPHTTCGRRKDEQDEESEQGTYVVEGKSERQTRVKLESLERRLRMNEQARKETEEQLETWKARSMKAEKLLPELNAKLMDQIRKNESLMEQSSDAAAKIRVSEEEKEIARGTADENEKRLKELCCHVASLLIEDQQELDLVRQCPAEVVSKVRESLGDLKRKEEENRLLLEQVGRHEERLERSRAQVEGLTAELQKLRRIDVERRDEQIQELHLNQETSQELKQNIHRMETSATQFQLEIEMLKAELRCVKSRNLELEQSFKNLNVLCRSAESEKKAFLETIAALLGKEETDEIVLKRSIRELTSEADHFKAERTKLEEETRLREEIILSQAKQLRHALFRARTSDEEIATLTEKFQAVEQELTAAELELSAAQKKIDEFEEAVQKLADLLDVRDQTKLSAVLERVVELVNFESTYSELFGDSKLASEIRILRLGQQEARHMDTLRKRLRAVECESVKQETTGGGRKAADAFDKQLLTQVTLDTIRAADSQKVAMKNKLHEQEKKIRDLEREKRETEKLRTVIHKWDRKDKSQKTTQK